MTVLNNITMYPAPDANPTDMTVVAVVPTTGLPSPLIVIYEQPIGSQLVFPPMTSVFPWTA